MARGTLKNLKRTRPSSGVDKTKAGGHVLLGQDPGVGQSASADLEGPDLVGWLNCECFFSLVLVGLLAALPFNLHCNEVFQTRETYLTRADEYFTEQAYDKAATLYERALSAEETPEGHAALAETFLRLNRMGDATIHLARAEELIKPEDVAKVPSMVKIGKLYRDLGRAESAALSYERILRLKDGVNSKDMAEAHLQVALSLLQSHRHEEAVEHLEAATTQSDALPATLAQAHYLLATVYHDMGQLDKAVGRFRKAVKNAPRDLNALSSLAVAYHESGNFKQALIWYKKVQQLSTPAAVDMVQHIITALTPPHEAAAAASVTTKASSPFLSLLFDLQAKRRVFMTSGGLFGASAVPPLDDWLDEETVTAAEEIFGLVHRNVSRTMRQMVDSVLGLPADSRVRWLDVLDLGCGMGQAGQHFRSLSNRLVGLDLSKAAVEVAAGRGLYDEVRQGEIEANLTTLLSGGADLVVLSDVVPYFGPLEPLLSHVLTVLRPGGFMLISADRPQPEECSAATLLSRPSQQQQVQYVLRPTGRWMHCPMYVEEVVRRMGLEVVRTMTLSASTHYRMGTDGAMQRADKPIPQDTSLYMLQVPEVD